MCSNIDGLTGNAICTVYKLYGQNNCGHLTIKCLLSMYFYCCYNILYCRFPLSFGSGLCTGHLSSFISEKNKVLMEFVLYTVTFSWQSSFGPGQVAQINAKLQCYKIWKVSIVEKVLPNYATKLNATVLVCSTISFHQQQPLHQNRDGSVRGILKIMFYNTS